MSLLEKIQGRVKDNAEASQAAMDEPFTPVNRYQRRAVVQSQKRRGPGWTRLYRKGREQRP